MVNECSFTLKVYKNSGPCVYLKNKWPINIALFRFHIGRDLICIQSMDGMLMLFEQESYAFGRFLPGFLLPGPLTYSSRTDSFITVSSSRQVESYKYVYMLIIVWGFFVAANIECINWPNGNGYVLWKYKYHTYILFAFITVVPHFSMQEEKKPITRFKLPAEWFYCSFGRLCINLKRYKFAL